MTEREKAQEAIKWFELFDLITDEVNKYATSATEFNNGVKNEIKRFKKKANEILNSK